MDNYGLILVNTFKRMISKDEDIYESLIPESHTLNRSDITLHDFINSDGTPDKGKIAEAMQNFCVLQTSILKKEDGSALFDAEVILSNGIECRITIPSMVEPPKREARNDDEKMEFFFNKYFTLKLGGLIEIDLPGIKIEETHDAQNAFSQLLMAQWGDELRFPVSLNSVLTQVKTADNNAASLRMSELIADTLKANTELRAFMHLRERQLDSVEGLVMSGDLSDETLRVMVEDICQSNHFDTVGLLGILNQIAAQLPKSLAEESPFFMTKLVKISGDVVSVPKIMERYLEGAPSALVYQFIKATNLPDDMLSCAMDMALQNGAPINHTKVRRMKY